MVQRGSNRTLMDCTTNNPVADLRGRSLSTHLWTRNVALCESFLPGTIESDEGLSA